MEFIVLFIILFLRNTHMAGFSGWRRKGWKSLYVITDDTDLEIIVNGYSTGLKTPSKLYMSPTHSTLQLQLARGGKLVYQELITLKNKDNFILPLWNKRPSIAPVIQLM